LTVVAQALDLIESTGEREYEAEWHRLEGVLLLSQHVPATARAETCLRRALDIARRRDARSHELRAATSLAPVVGWFSEGFGTADLQEATAFLAAVAGPRSGSTIRSSRR